MAAGTEPLQAKMVEAGVERQRDISAPWNWPAPLLVLALAFAFAVPLLLVRSISDFPFSKVDLTAVWVGDRAELQGSDPYADASTKQIQTLYYGRPLTAADHANKMGYAYPAYTALVLAPLSWVSCGLARLLFLGTMSVLMAASVPLWLATLGVELKAKQVAVVTCVALASWPMVWALRLCQPTLLVAGFFALGAYCLRRRLDAIAGVCFALTIVKPQLAGLAIAWSLLWAVAHRRWTFVAGTLGGMTVLLAWAQRHDAGWISRWIAAMVDYSHYTRVAPGLQLVLGPWLGSAAMLGFAVAAGMVLWRMRNVHMPSASLGAGLSLALALTVCLTPTDLSMIYNQILLLPALLMLCFASAKPGDAGMARSIALRPLQLNYLCMLAALIGLRIWPQFPGWLLLPTWNYYLPVAVVLAMILHLWNAVPAKADAVCDADVSLAFRRDC